MDSSSGPSSSRSLQRVDNTHNQGGEWWDNLSRSNLQDLEFWREFRMSYSTFKMISDHLQANENNQDNTFLMEKRLASCIRRLATGESFSDISLKFGISHTSCRRIFYNVCSKINDACKVVQWPDNDDEFARITLEYENRFEVPNIVGSMYTNRIPVSLDQGAKSLHLNPTTNVAANQQVIIQGVVDPRGCFRHYYIYGPAPCITDYELFVQSELPQRPHGDWIVARTGFPLIDGILVPYSNYHSVTDRQRCLNSRVKRIQNVGEDAFKRLRGRWSFLQKPLECTLESLPVVIETCCVLHNICQSYEEKMDANLISELTDAEMVVDYISPSAAQARDITAENAEAIALRGRHC